MDIEVTFVCICSNGNPAASFGAFCLQIESGREAELLLESVGIVTNKNLIPFDTLNSNLTSGIRIGSPLMTTRGAKEAEMEYIGHLIGNTLKSKDDKDKLNHIAEQVKKIVNRYPMFSDEWVVMK